MTTFKERQEYLQQISDKVNNFIKNDLQAEIACLKVGIGSGKLNTNLTLVEGQRVCNEEFKGFEVDRRDNGKNLMIRITVKAENLKI